MSTLATPSGVRSPSVAEGSLSPSDQRNRGSSSLSWNPISLRLYKVLGANFEDPGTKEALETLSAFYTSPSTSTSPVARQANGEADASSDSDEDVFSAPTERRKDKTATYTPGDTASRARKSLRRDTEAKLAEGSQRFLKAFGEVDEVRFALPAC